MKLTFSRVTIAVGLGCLVKLAFFNDPTAPINFIPQAHAQGAIVEWNDARRIVTSGSDGATTYVWDYAGKTKVRRYTLKNDKLTMRQFELEEVR